MTDQVQSRADFERWFGDYHDELHLRNGVTAQRLIKRILPSLKELS